MSALQHGITKRSLDSNAHEALFPALRSVHQTQRQLIRTENVILMKPVLANSPHTHVLIKPSQQNYGEETKQTNKKPSGVYHLQDGPSLTPNSLCSLKFIFLGLLIIFSNVGANVNDQFIVKQSLIMSSCNTEVQPYSNKH